MRACGLTEMSRLSRAGMIQTALNDPVASAFAPRPTRAWGHRSPRPDQYGQDDARHRTDAGPSLGPDWSAAAAAGARGLCQARREGRRRGCRPRHRRGKDQAARRALLGGDRRSDAARHRCLLPRHRRDPDRRRPERGHVFTDRILNRRGRDETMLLGAGTMRGLSRSSSPASTSSPGRVSRTSPSRARRRSPACRAARPSSPSRPTRSMRSPS